MSWITDWEYLPIKRKNKLITWYVYYIYVHYKIVIELICIKSVLKLKKIEAKVKNIVIDHT